MFPSLIFISEGGKGLFIRKRRPIVSPVAGPADDRHHQECSNERHQYQDREPMRRLRKGATDPIYALLDTRARCDQRDQPKDKTRADAKQKGQRSTLWQRTTRRAGQVAAT